MKIRFLHTFLTIGFLFFGVLAFAQPANDNCANAISIPIAEDELSCVPTEGNTVGGTASTTPTSVCSGTWFQDDIWFSFTTGPAVPTGGIVVKAYFGDSNDDVPAIGMAIYPSCGMTEVPLACFSSALPEDDQIALFAGNLETDHTYYVRVWSGVSPTANSGTVRLCAFEGEPDNATVIWNADFNDGLGDWSTMDLSGTDSTHMWEYTTTGSNGAFGAYVLTSPSSANGYFMFDADFFSTGGDPNNAPPGPPYPQYESALVSPIIDCSSCPPVSVRFWQFYRALNGDTYMDWSVDGGNTWIGRVNVNELVEPNAQTAVPSVKRYFIPDFAGQDSARVRFVFDGDFYAWLVDDVQIIETERNNLRVMENWWAIPTNRVTPASQVEDFGFVADIYNAGSSAQPNTVLTVTVEEATGTVPLYTDQLNYGTIAADSLAENQIFPDLYSPEEGLVTDYTITYTVSSDSTDFDLTDNSLSHVYSTSDTVFAKETGATRSLRPADALWPDGVPHSWSIGNYYYVVNDQYPNGDPIKCTSTTIGITNPQDHAGKIVSVVLYEFSDDNDDQLVQLSERTGVAFAAYEITGNEMANAVITLPIADGSGNAVNLSANTEYIMLFNYATELDDDNLFVEASEEYDFSAGVWLTEQLGDPRYSHVLQIGGEDDLRLVPTAAIGTTNFGHDIVPLIRMNLNSQITSTNILSADNLLNVYPNPANNLLNVDIELVNTAEKAEVKIIDLTGKIVDYRRYDELQKETINFDVSHLTAGGYFIHILTKEGQRSKYFVVQR